jgi:hypothetical protein
LTSNKKHLILMRNKSIIFGSIDLKTNVLLLFCETLVKERRHLLTKQRLSVSGGKAIPPFEPKV